MAYKLYYTENDGIRSQTFDSLQEVKVAYSALPRKLKPAWVCDADEQVILGRGPEPSAD
jgi:hypothetical protein